MESVIVHVLFLTQQSLSSGWDYDAQGTWSDDYPMCGTEDQSPVDIKPLDAVFDSEICLPWFDWDIEFDHTDFLIRNWGLGIALQPVQETNIDPNGELAWTIFDANGTEYTILDESENAIGKFPNYFKPADSPHTEFCFHSFHFHWGRMDEMGSEHFIDGHQYALEAHFVHYSCLHASLGTTLSQFPDENSVLTMEATGEDSQQMATVAILFDVIEDYINPAFEALLSDDILSAVKTPDNPYNTIVHELNLKDLIPNDVKIDGYFAYEGSLTTPPCTPIVRWHVMNAKGKIGKSQMERFRVFQQNEYDHIQIAPNYRELQENVNTVYGCMDAPHVTTGFNTTAFTETLVVDKQTTNNILTDQDTVIIVKEHPLSIVMVAIIACLITAIIIGVFSFIIYKKNKQKIVTDVNKSIEQSKHKIEINAMKIDENKGNEINAMKIDEIKEGQKTADRYA